MSFIDLPKIRQSVSFYLAHFEVLALLTLVGGILGGIPEALASAGLGDAAVLITSFAAGILNLALFVVIVYVCYQLYTGAPLSRMQCLYVLRERFGRVLYIYLRVFLVSLFYSTAAILPVMIADHAASPAAAVAIGIPMAVLWSITLVRYLLVLYYAVFEKDIGYAEARDKSFAYVTPRRRRILVTLFVAGLVTFLALSLVQKLLLLLLAKGWLADMIAGLLSSLLIMPLSLLCFFFYMEARSLERRGGRA